MTGGIPKKTLIMLTNEEFLLFKRLEEVFPDLAVMLDQGVFNFRNGKAIIHRDDKGVLMGIDFDVKTWRRKKEM